MLHCFFLKLHSVLFQKPVAPKGLGVGPSGGAFWGGVPYGIVGGISLGCSRPLPGSAFFGIGPDLSLANALVSKGNLGGEVSL